MRRRKYTDKEFPMKFSSLAVCVMVATASLTVSMPRPSAADSEERIGKIELQVKGLHEENAALKKRLENVEIAGEEDKQNLTGLSNLVDVSGYADFEYTFTDQSDANNGFRLHHLSLFFSKNIEKEWRFFSEIEYEDAPRIVANTASDTLNKAQGVIFVEQMFIQYHPKYDWDVRLGRFLTPAGYWGIYHYPPYVPTQRYPLFFKVMFPEVSDGLQFRKTVPLGDMTVDSHVYVANGSGNSGNGDRNSNKGVGARLNFNILPGFSAGASYYRERDNMDSLNSTYGTHLLIAHRNIKVLTEYIKRNNKPRAAASFNDESWYSQLSYDIDHWTVAGRYDWYDQSDKVSGNCHYRYTGAVNYHFAHNVVGKAEYNRNEFESKTQKNYNEVIFSVVAAIGDL